MVKPKPKRTLDIVPLWVRLAPYTMHPQEVRR